MSLSQAMSNIIDLQETGRDNWQAKYRGNYGIYTIRIKTDGKEITDFSCSCPSDGYPCKHIPIVWKEIEHRMEKGQNNSEEKLIEKVVRNIPLKELQNFVIHSARYNPTLSQTILLEFASSQKQPEKTPYAEIIRNGLSGVGFDYEDTYDFYDGGFEIDVLEQWLGKAAEYSESGNYAESVAIAKACLEEYSTWIDEVLEGKDLLSYIGDEYQCAPFNLLQEAKAVGYLPANELLDYYRKESEKKKYRGTDMYDMLEDRIMDLTAETDPNAYITVLNEQFDELSDKSSYDAEKLLERKINFYKAKGDEDEVWTIIRNNIQITSFREQWVKRLIDERQFDEAKRLINDPLEKSDSIYDAYSHFQWNDYLLQIAQLEGNKGEVQRISKYFLNKRFSLEDYNLYKSTFSEDEWPAKMEKLIKQYQKNSSFFTASVADVLVAENLKERLLHYIAQHCSVDSLESYYTDISAEYPKKTILLFKKTINDYLKNTGRNIYEHVVSLFRKMLKIEGGKEAVAELTAQFRIQYKNRKAMIEIIDGFCRKEM